MQIPLDELLRFVKEDAPFGDITSEAVLPDTECRAVVVVKESGIVAGILEARMLFEAYGITVTQHVRDGSPVSPQDTLLSLDGKAKSILLVERTALNIIGRMSGIASKTKEFTERLKNIVPGARIAATRKTCPGFRLLDKKAVMIGGGEPHRFSLSDRILIKDNHLAIVPLAEAIARAKQWSRFGPIEVEVGNPEQALMAVQAGADIIMLDNMTPEAVNETVAVLTRHGLRERVLLELSGGITIETIDHFAGCQVDIISAGAITHSISHIDVSLEVLPGARSVTL